MKLKKKKNEEEEEENRERARAGGQDVLVVFQGCVLWGTHKAIPGGSSPQTTSVGSVAVSVPYVVNFCRLCGIRLTYRRTYHAMPYRRRNKTPPLRTLTPTNYNTAERPALQGYCYGYCLLYGMVWHIECVDQTVQVGYYRSTGPLIGNPVVREAKIYGKTGAPWRVLC